MIDVCVAVATGLQLVPPLFHVAHLEGTCGPWTNASGAWTHACMHAADIQARRARHAHRHMTSYASGAALLLASQSERHAFMAINCRFVRRYPAWPMHPAQTSDDRGPSQLQSHICHQAFCIEHYRFCDPIAQTTPTVL